MVAIHGYLRLGDIASVRITIIDSPSVYSFTPSQLFDSKDESSLVVLNGDNFIADPAMLSIECNGNE